MARASSRLPALYLLFFFFFFFFFYHCSTSSILVRFAGAASIGDNPPPQAEPSEAEPDRSKAHSSSTGRVWSYEEEVLPLWRNLTGGMASLTTNFSFQIIPYLRRSSSSWFAWTMSHVYGQNLGLHPFQCNTETDTRFDVNSTEYTETTSPTPSKNLSSVLLPPRVSHLASPHAAPRSLDYSGPPVFSVLQEQQTAVDFSAGSVENNVEFHNLSRRSSPITRRSERVPRRERYGPPNDTVFHRILQEEDSLQPPDEPAWTRKVLSGKYDQRATRKRHGASRGKVASSSWLEQPAVAGSVLICTVAGLLLCCIRRKRPWQRTAAIQLENDDEQIIAEPELRRGLGPREFCYSDLAAATDNFAEERRIGRGGFGPVYRGCLSEEGRHVAIKVLSKEMSVQGLKEFQAEVTVMSQLRHRNIVRLVGWCGRPGGLALVYELVSGGSLDAHLYNPDRHLTWPQRYKIALQLGSALRYLHADCDQCVVHGDIKPANVMLDASLDAKLGDFGLARLVDHGAEPQTTQVVAGTVGYIDPEFVSSRRPSAESDVYSFGVVLLEIACGRRPTTSRRTGQAASAKALLLASVRDMYRRNVILEAADRRLDGEFDEMEMERLLVTGLWCSQQDPVRRPSVARAMDVLRSEDVELPVLGTMAGSEEIRALQGQAYGDLPAESSADVHESTETAYLTTEETTNLFAEEQ